MRAYLLPLPFVLLIACTPEVIVQPSPSSSGGSGGTTPQPCATCVPTCPDSPPVPGTSCDTNDFTECRYPSGQAGCDEVYECQPVYPEAGAPSDWVFVGNFGICSCSPPSCDAGDTPLGGACPPDASCYTAANECGDLVYCADDSYPEHGCPEAEPVSGAACSSFGQSCTYPIGNDCFTFYECYAGSGWQPVGGGCSGSSGTG